MTTPLVPRARLAAFWGLAIGGLAVGGVTSVVLAESESVECEAVGPAADGAPAQPPINGDATGLVVPSAIISPVDLSRKKSTPTPPAEGLVLSKADKPTSKPQSIAASAPPEAKAVPASPPELKHGVFRWTSYPAAWTEAQKSNRPILVYVSSTRCPYCVRMVSETFQSPRVRDAVVGSFETVYVDRHAQPELVAALGVKLFPTTVLVSPSNQVTDFMEGYVAADAFGRRLQTNLAAAGGAHAKR